MISRKKKRTQIFQFNKDDCKLVWKFGRFNFYLIDSSINTKQLHSIFSDFNSEYF